MDIIGQLRQLRLETFEVKTLLWQQSFLTPKWWFIAIVIAISYAIWWRFTDKKRIIELLLFGSFIAVSRVIFDDWGITSGRWTYVIDLVPLGISLFLNDLTIVPLSYMLAYQYSPTWSKFIILIIVLQSFLSFGFLPLLSRIGILVMHNWHFGYTLVFMVVTATIMRAIILFSLDLQKRARIEYSSASSAALIPQPALKPTKEDEKNDHSDPETIKNKPS